MINGRTHVLSSSSPHPVGRLVPGVPVELGDAEAGLGEDGQEADGLDEGLKVPQEVHQDAPGDGQGHDALHVGLEVGPLPEEARLEI